VLSDLRSVEAETRDNDRMTVVLAVSYGGRQDIVGAARQLARQVRDGELKPEQINESRLAGSLMTAGLPDPDLLIRTSGELRISNFLLWQCAYSELYFTDVAWPDFRRDQFLEAINWYAQRDRRFGGRATGELAVEA
jgi:undecaprenyl diphosphate synthase